MLERADFTLELVSVCNKICERKMYTIFYVSIFGHLLCCSCDVKHGRIERVKTRKAQINLPRRQLFTL